MSLDEKKLKRIIESAIFSAGRPLSIEKIALLFEEEHRPSNPDIKKILALLAQDYHDKGIALVEVSSGWRFQSRQEFAPWIQKLWEERPSRYSRASLETLSLIAYRQPVTRGEIEEIRGVSVSSNIIKSFMEREWIRIVGHRDVPGRPALFATTKQFLDYFNLKSLDDLPTLAEIKDFESINPQFDLEDKPPQPNDDIKSETIEAQISTPEVSQQTKDEQQETPVDNSSSLENLDDKVLH